MYKTEPVLEIDEESTKKDREHTKICIGFNKWLRRERERSMHRLPNHLRLEASHIYDHFNYYSD